MSALLRSYETACEELVVLESLVSDRGMEGSTSMPQAWIDGFMENLIHLEESLLFSGQHDAFPARCRLKAGAGGTEAQAWTETLFRMYERCAERNGLRLVGVSSLKGSEAGCTQVDFTVEGTHAYGLMRSEHGVHRLSRVSPFGKLGKRQTSFSSVEVVPVLPEKSSEVSMSDADVRVDTFRGSGPGGQHRNVTDSAVRVTHIPTGRVTTCQSERSQHQNKQRAMRTLTDTLQGLEDAATLKALRSLAGDKGTAAFGHQIRSYVLHPYRMVKDHRTGHTDHDAAAVLAGEVAPFMHAWLRHSARIEIPAK